jgi:hypothetical protein
MKTILKISVLTFLLIAASSHCFADQQNMEVSKERAKELGVTIRSHLNGQSGVKVWLEFVPKGGLKDFTRVDLTIRAGEKCLVDAPLLTSHPTPESVTVYFSTDAANLPASVLTIVVQKGERTRIGYQFKVKDFI